MNIFMCGCVMGGLLRDIGVIVVYEGSGCKEIGFEDEYVRICFF